MTPFQYGFLKCALFWSTDPNGCPLHEKYTIDDFAPEIFTRLCADCDNFERENAADLADVQVQLCKDSSQYRGYTDAECRAEQAGHDFWLARSVDGCEFGDDDYSEPHASRLTNAAHTFRKIDLYVGDDGKIYARR